MAKNKSIGIIGCGNMGEAIVRGLLLSGYSCSCVCIYDKSKSKVSSIRRKFKVIAAGDNYNLVLTSDIVILAVKPQDFDTLLNEISGGFDNSKLIISIAAGITTKYIQKRLGKIRIIRAMPNMPAQIGKGITALTKGRFAKPADLKTAEKIFKTLGEVEKIGSEADMDIVTALSGSGPAYLFFIFNAMLAVAKKICFSKKSAEKLISNTISGAMELLKDNKFAAEGLISRVASKGGTTQAALKVFLDRKLNKIIFDAIIAAYDRAKELSR